MSTDKDVFPSHLPDNIEFSIVAQDTAKEFGNVYVQRNGDTSQIQLTLLMNPQQQLSKAWKTGVAMDASASMKNVYGRRMLGHLPRNVTQEFKRKGWIIKETRDNRNIITFPRAAADEALKRGLISLSPNLMDFVAPELVAYMAGNLDTEGQTSLFYWAGNNGAELEFVGKFDKTDAACLSIDGPDKMRFGNSSRLLPAVQHLVENYQDAPMGLFIFITDGHINDLQQLKQYTDRLAEDIASGRHNFVKCILVGIGEEINEANLQALITPNPHNYVKIWNYLIISDLEEMLKMFADIISEEQLVAEYGTIYDAHGNILKEYPHGIPNRVVFSMPSSSPWFELDLPGKQRIKQMIKVPLYILGGYRP